LRAGRVPAVKDPQHRRGDDPLHSRAPPAAPVHGPPEAQEHPARAIPHLVAIRYAPLTTLQHTLTHLQYRRCAEGIPSLHCLSHIQRLQRPLIVVGHSLFALKALISFFRPVAESADNEALKLIIRTHFSEFADY
jgi:hypothetical protein